MSPGQSFLLSLVRVSGKRFLVSLLVSCCLLGSLDLALRHGLIARIPEKYLMRSRFDTSAHAAHAAARARNLPVDVTPVYALGGSGMREALMTAEEFDEIIKASTGGGRYRSFVLAGHFNTPARDLATLDLIAARPGIIVYGVSFTRFSFGPRRYDMQLSGTAGFGRNGVLLQYMEEHHPQTVRVNALQALLTAHTHLVPATRLFAEKARDHFAPLVYQQHRYGARAPDAAFERQLARWKKIRLQDHIPRYFNINMELLALFIRRALDQGHQVLVVEQPLDREHLAGRLDETLAYYRPRLEQLAIESGARYADFEKELGISTESFGDLQHLWRGRARRAFTERILAEIQQMQSSDR